MCGSLSRRRTGCSVGGFQCGGELHYLSESEACEGGKREARVGTRSSGGLRFEPRQDDLDVQDSSGVSEAERQGAALAVGKGTAMARGRLAPL